jgi:predicted O-methyltransferase YrrM
MTQTPPQPATTSPAPSAVNSGILAVDRYLAQGFATVPGMSSRFAAAVCGGLLRIQHELAVRGPLVEIGAFEGRFFIALAHALGEGETALAVDRFDWPDPGVVDRFEANCTAHGVPPQRRVTLKADSHSLAPHELLAQLKGERVRFVHIDGEHSRAALTRDLELATAVLAPAGVIVLDDMLHPGYPTLILAVEAYLARHPDMCVLAIIDRESIVAAAKFVLCEKAWFKRYEARLLGDFAHCVWPLGADFEPHWCLVLSLDTRLAPIR